MGFKKVKIDLVDELEKEIGRGLGLASGATAAEFSDLLNAYSAVTDCGVVGARATEALPTLLPDSTFTATTAQAGSRRWREGRITVGLAPHANGAGQLVGTINIPGIKASLVSGNSIVDSGGIIAALLVQLGMDDGTNTPGKGLISDGQAVTGFISGYVHNKPHNGDED